MTASTVRPFVAWDGEGCKGEQEYHPYSLFGASTGHRVKYFDLSTLDCLDLIMQVEKENRNAIHVGYSFGYDVNMILKDLPLPQLWRLRKYNKTVWRGYVLEHIPHKWFAVSYGMGKKRTHAKIFDVFLFFNTGFGKALRKYNIGTTEDLDRIDAGKAERPDFSFDNIDEIERYWETELKYLVELMDKLRSILYGAGFKISSWHGPGALAGYALNQHNTRLHMDRGLDQKIIEASRYGYFGGRFQAFQAGYYEGPVYTYDINSAYGYSHSRLPSLTSGKWVHTSYPDREATAYRRLGLYRIAYKGKMGTNPMPLPHRDRDNSISYPVATSGWFHAPEAAILRKNTSAEFLESWEYADDGEYPFSWIEEAFEERLELQRKEDPSEKAIKWTIAALYGQVAQRAGWERSKGPPRWHQLEWAGAITSECRAMIYVAARRAGSGLISIDTDGIITTTPISKLPNGYGDRLGQWKAEEFSGVLYLQNGIYWLRDSEGNWLPPKSRGIPRKKLDFEAVYPQIKANKNLELTQHMFLGYGLALRGNIDDWRKWLDVPRKITFGGSGKSVHVPSICPACASGKGWGDALHRLFQVQPREIKSHPHKLPWLEPAPLPEDQFEQFKKWGIYDYDAR